MNMKIVRKDINLQIYNDVKCGDWFIRNDRLYVKSIAMSGEHHLSFDVAGGYTQGISLGEIVQVVNVTIIVEK